MLTLLLRAHKHKLSKIIILSQHFKDLVLYSLLTNFCISKDKIKQRYETPYHYFYTSLKNVCKVALKKLQDIYSLIQKLAYNIFKTLVILRSTYSPSVREYYFHYNCKFTQLEMQNCFMNFQNDDFLIESAVKTAESGLQHHSLAAPVRQLKGLICPSHISCGV